MEGSLLEDKHSPVILRYSSVSAVGDYRPPELAVSPRLFEAQVAYLARHCTVLALDVFIALRDEVRFPRNCVVITFDGGYKDNVETALPILERYGLPATFFVTSDPALGRGGYWPEWLYRIVSAAPESVLREVSTEFLGLPDQALPRGRVFALLARQVHLSRPGADNALLADIERTVRIGSPLCAPSEFMMNLKDLYRLLRAGMTIGSHTATYRNLSQLNRLEALTELVGSKVELEFALSHPIDHLAYPDNGGLNHIGSNTIALAELSRYRSASSTYRRTSMKESLYDLPRQPINEADCLQSFGKRLQGCLRNDLCPRSQEDVV